VSLHSGTTLLKFPFRLLLLLLFLKNEREGEEIVLFGFFQSYNSFFFSLAQNFIVFRCTSFIEREHQPSLKAIKKVRKRKEKKSHHELAPPEPPGLATTIL
jgi:hypothetical protein